MHFVALFQSSQNCDGVFNARLADIHLLESSFKGRIFFNILAVLIKSGCTNHTQLTTGQHRFDHVASVHGAFSTTSADDGMQLIYERNHFAGSIGNFLQHGLQAFFKFTAILCSCEQARDIKRNQPLVLQSLRHITFGDSTCETFNNCGLTDTGLTDQHWVVLSTATQHLNYSANLVVTANNWINLSIARSLREILAILLERLKILFGILCRDPMTSADITHCLHEFFTANTQATIHREQQVFNRKVVVLEIFLVLLSVLKNIAEFTIHTRLIAAVRFRQLGNFLVSRVAHHERGLAQLGKHCWHDGVVLANNGCHEVIRGKFWV